MKDLFSAKAMLAALSKIESSVLDVRSFRYADGSFDYFFKLNLNGDIVYDFVHVGGELDNSTESIAKSIRFFYSKFENIEQRGIYTRQFVLNLLLSKFYFLCGEYKKIKFIDVITFAEELLNKHRKAQDLLKELDEIDMEIFYDASRIYDV